MSIAGSDPSGGAGIQADLKTFAALGCFGQAAITALTVQNTLGVLESHPVEPSLVVSQVRSVWEDLMPDAVKIGITATKGTILQLAELIRQFRPPFIVLDPVMVSSSGHLLMEEEACQSLLEQLMPLCTLITPNIPEAAALLGLKRPEDSEVMAQKLLVHCGGVSVLVKGGHAQGQPTDVLFHKGLLEQFSAERVDTNNTHGTGCTLSSAIAAYVARGEDLPQAVMLAKKYLTEALVQGTMVYAGHGKGSMNHFFAPEAALLKENA